MGAEVVQLRSEREALRRQIVEGLAQFAEGGPDRTEEALSLAGKAGLEEIEALVEEARRARARWDREAPAAAVKRLEAKWAEFDATPSILSQAVEPAAPSGSVVAGLRER